MSGYLLNVNIKKSLLAGIDAGLKALLAIILIVAAMICEKQVSLLLIFSYTVIATILLGSNFRFLLKNVVSYAIIFMFPYLFGLLLSILFGIIFSNNQSATDLVFKEALLRMIKIFFVWYIGSLYICSTPLESILGMLKKVLQPLNSFGVPIGKHLNIIKCIVIELNQSVSEFKNNTLAQARNVIKDRNLSFRTKIKEISNILVCLIANSLHKTEHIQELVARTNANDFIYNFRFSRNEIIASFSLIILLAGLTLMETVKAI
jgi:energy-coupling factor transporter transmembrane protein EcfT